MSRKPYTYQRRRDPEATRLMLKDALVLLITTSSPEKIGPVNVARTAGVDKVLIYRYFGGMEGLFKELGEDNRLWPLPEIKKDKKTYDWLKLKPERRVSRFMAACMRALRNEPFAIAVLAWSMIDMNPLIDAQQKLR